MSDETPDQETPGTDNQGNDKTTRTRAGTGRFDRDPDTATRDAECARLRARSMSYRAIAAELGISVSQAHEGVSRALRDTLEEPAEDVRRLELEKLDALERAALDVLEGQHQVIFQGNPTGIIDPGPQLQAVTALVRIGESRRKLLGLDQPAKIDLSGGVKYVLEGVNTADLT